ncbi:hypothetical protein [Streptomyces sp. NPDC004528]|uniref:hypothetical protein n=1 Tax=Streptomyces sp. NPDC004528 TaxID=3154550 RepID=UPI0033BC09DE
MSVNQDAGPDQPDQPDPSRWQRIGEWLKREGKFVADNLHPQSAGQPRGRRAALWAGGLIGVVVLAVIGLLISLQFAGRELAATDGAQGALDEEKGYVHASIRPQAIESYEAPWSVFSATSLSQRQVTGIKRGEYTAEVFRDKDPIGAVTFDPLVTTPPNFGQIYFVDLVSDSSSMVTVTDIDAVNIRCRPSTMVARLDIAADGTSAIDAVAFPLQDGEGSANAFISDVNDEKYYGSEYFNHKTIELGGGAEHQTLSVLGVAHVGSYCSWDLLAKFTTDDGEEHRKRLNKQPLTSEGGPAEGPGTQRLSTNSQIMSEWCQRKPDSARCHP